MRERAALVGGTIDVESSPGEGTRIELRIPISSAAVDDSGPSSPTD
jgi:chemotaxis protein histidine kinase CheA